jgi:hypothetical protein
LFEQSIRLRAVVPSGLVLAALACLCGCRGTSTALGEVSGKVTFEGKPVKEGRVTFQNPESGAAADARLNEDGTYTLSAALPAGEYKVTVTPLIERRQVDGKGPVVGEEKPAPDIPEKYRTVGSTELKATVKEGKNDFNFDMKR